MASSPHLRGKVDRWRPGREGGRDFTPSCYRPREPQRRLRQHKERRDKKLGSRKHRDSTGSVRTANLLALTVNINGKDRIHGEGVPPSLKAARPNPVARITALQTRIGPNGPRVRVCTEGKDAGKLPIKRESPASNFKETPVSGDPWDDSVPQANVEETSDHEEPWTTAKNVADAEQKGIGVVMKAIVNNTITRFRGTLSDESTNLNRTNKLRDEVFEHGRCGKQKEVILAQALVAKLKIREIQIRLEYHCGCLTLEKAGKKIWTLYHLGEFLDQKNVAKMGLGDADLAELECAVKLVEKSLRDGDEIMKDSEARSSGSA